MLYAHMQEFERLFLLFLLEVLMSVHDWRTTCSLSGHLRRWRHQTWHEL